MRTSSLSRNERRMAKEILPGGDAAFATRTRVDTGSWLLRSRVLACREGDELVLFAAGKQPFVERIPLSDIGESFYNHVTGEVALAPAAGASLRGLRLPPLEGYALLKEVGLGT